MGGKNRYGAHLVLRSQRLLHHLLDHRIFRLEMFAVMPVFLCAASSRPAVCFPKYIKLREVSIAVPPVSTLFSICLLQLRALRYTNSKASVFAYEIPNVMMGEATEGLR